MGRRGIPVTDDDRWVFNRLADDYAARPGWPEPLLHRLLDLAGGPGATIADLGAGTGFLAIPLGALGARVAAVEPARAMLRRLEARAAPGVRALHATAEDTGLPTGSSALVVLADAIQWVDPDGAGREAARILAPGGAVAVVEARLAGDRFSSALSDLLARANFKARPGASGRRAHFLSTAGVAAWSSERFSDAEPLAPERLDAVLRSLSYVGPALGPPALDELLAEARRLASAEGGVWRREITLTWGRPRRGGAR